MNEELLNIIKEQNMHLCEIQERLEEVCAWLKQMDGDNKEIVRNIRQITDNLFKSE